MVGIRDQLKVEIVEHSNEVSEKAIDERRGKSRCSLQVFPILIRDIGTSLKPGEDVALVRFDSFADLLVPKDIKADEIQTLNHLVEYVTER